MSLVLSLRPIFFAEKPMGIEFSYSLGTQHRDQSSLIRSSGEESHFTPNYCLPTSERREGSRIWTLWSWLSDYDRLGKAELG